MASWEVSIDSMGHSIRVAEGRGGGWLNGRYALTPSELLKVEGEGIASCIYSIVGRAGNVVSKLLNLGGWFRV